MKFSSEGVPPGLQGVERVRHWRPLVVQERQEGTKQDILQAGYMELKWEVIEKMQSLFTLVQLYNSVLVELV